MHYIRYAYPDVDKKQEAIDMGEVLPLSVLRRLISKVIDLHPWFDTDMQEVEEATSIAVRIARASTKKDMFYSVVTMVGLTGIFLQIS